MFFLFNVILVLSVIYSVRLVLLVFARSFSGFSSSLVKVHEPSLKMLVPLLILALFSIFAGYIFKDLFVGLGVSGNKSPVFGSFREILFSSDMENWSSFVLKLFTFFISAISSVIVLRFYSEKTCTFFRFLI